MYIPDATHQKLDKAQMDLENTRKALEEARWAAVKLKTLHILMERGGDVDFQFLKDTIAMDKARLADFPATLAVGLMAVNQAGISLQMAKDLIPNTTPPDPRGFEMFSTPATPAVALAPSDESGHEVFGG